MPRDQYTIGHTSEFRREDNGQGTMQTHTVQVRGTVTMDELITELAAYGATREVYVSNATIKWDSEASLESLEHREQMRKESALRQEQYERRQLSFLMDKYDVRAIEQSEDAEVVSEE